MRPTCPPPLRAPQTQHAQDWRSHLPPHSQMPVAFGGALMTPTPPASQAGRSTSLILDSSLFLSSLLRLIACPAPTGQASIRIPFVYRSCLLPWLLTASGNVSRQVKVLEIHIPNHLICTFETFMAHFLSDLIRSLLLPDKRGAEKCLR